ncbi:hypothetical protein [Anaerobacillus alkalilacustris]|uniref:hypothetical protein n=1 Tax=Anaerobacillus alkalilacustris TaxID=393763 RepID=UPI000AF3669A|nr:hypothetical protein [Anaerobacillus alkalilacustris]
MEVEMSMDEVVSSINQLHSDGQMLAKKKVKKSHPELMRSALHYFPSWEHAIRESGIE